MRSVLERLASAPSNNSMEMTYNEQPELVDALVRHAEIQGLRDGTAVGAVPPVVGVAVSVPPTPVPASVVAVSVVVSEAESCA